MVPCHVCHIYGIWNLEKQRGGGMLYGVAMKATGGGGDNFNGEEGMHLFHIFLLRPVLYLLLRLARPNLQVEKS